MKKIKEFAALCGTSSKTLRFYDRIGLLEAEYTDPATGYRYYDEKQKDKYTVISLYKEIGFTLDGIKNDILGADESHLLEILREKEAELKKAHELCVQQIEAVEKSIQRKADLAEGKVSLTRYDDEGKIVITDGKETRIFVCAPEAMDICAEVMRDLFCSPVFVNIDLSDIETADSDRAVLIQTAEGTPEEVTALDPGELFGSPEEIKGIRSVLLMIKFPPSGGLDHVTAIAERVCTVFPPDCTVIWGVSFDDSSADRAKVCIAGVY